MGVYRKITIKADRFERLGSKDLAGVNYALFTKQRKNRLIFFFHFELPAFPMFKLIQKAKLLIQSQLAPIVKTILFQEISKWL